MPAWTALGVKSRIKVAFVVCARGAGASSPEPALAPPVDVEELVEEPHAARAPTAARAKAPKTAPRARARAQDHALPVNRPRAHTGPPESRVLHGGEGPRGLPGRRYLPFT